MKKAFILSIILVSFLTSLTSSAQNIDKNGIAGSWLGKINTGAMDLRIVFNLTLAGKDSLTATLDSPDQGAKGIKIGPVTITDENIKISAPMLAGEYNGTFRNDTLIEGTWKQAGRTTPLNLKKLKAPFTINRPQEPKPPFPYLTEDVTFINSNFNIKLAGTLTMPEGDGPFPAVVLITGSGAQNRNEELMGHKPFMVIADYLTRHKIAVLRYDDRGTGKSQGNYISATSADLATDAAAAYNFLRNNPKIDQKRIGLAGHSEGGLIAPIAASSVEDLAFIISLAGPGVTGEEIILRQGADISRVTGLDEKTIKANMKTNKKIFAILKKENDNKTASEGMVSEYKKILTKQKTPPEEAAKAIKATETSLSPSTLTWLRYFLITDPKDYWKNVKCPVLALNGEKDLQVAADENLSGISDALKNSGNIQVKTIKIEGVNHLFQSCKTGLPSEYGDIEETFSAEVLKIISDWILAL